MLNRFTFAPALVAFALHFAECTPSSAQELSSDEIKQLLSWAPEAEFQSQMEARFSDLKSPDNLRFDRLSSVIAVPLANLGDLSVNNLREGTVIGGLYLSSGSTRLRLNPGVYLVTVRFDDEVKLWKVDHLDADASQVISTMDARVEATSTVDDVLSYVDHSVCYQADSWVICY